MKIENLLRAMTLTIVLLGTAVQIEAQNATKGAPTIATTTQPISEIFPDSAVVTYADGGYDCTHKYVFDDETHTLTDYCNELYTAKSVYMLDSNYYTTGTNVYWTVFSRPVMIEGYTWDEINSVWVGQGKVEYTYDSYGFAESSTYYRWSESESSWVLSETENFSYEYTFNDKGQVICRIDEDSRKSEYSYYDNGYLQSVTLYKPNEENAYRKFTYIYDQNGNIIKLTSSEWCSENNEFVVGDEEEYTWNENNMPLTCKQYNDGELFVTYTYFYDGKSASISNVKIDDYAIERIYDMQGRQHSEMTKGLNIIKKKNGMTTKIIKR